MADAIGTGFAKSNRSFSSLNLVSRLSAPAPQGESRRTRIRKSMAQPEFWAQKYCQVFAQRHREAFAEVFHAHPLGVTVTAAQALVAQPIPSPGCTAWCGMKDSGYGFSSLSMSNESEN